MGRTSLESSSLLVRFARVASGPLPEVISNHQVAEELVMPMIDWDHITRGLVPGAYLFDDIHPTGNCAFF